MPIKEVDQPEIVEGSGAVGNVHVAGTGVPPRAMSVGSGHPNQLHNPLARSFRLHLVVAVVCVADYGVFAPLQFLVEVIEQDVR